MWGHASPHPETACQSIVQFFLCSENGGLCVKMFVIPKQKKIIVRSIERQNCVTVQKCMDLTTVHV